MSITKQTKRQARELLRLCHADGTLDANRVQVLLRRIVQIQPRGCLPVLVQFQRLLQREYAERTATVESATALSSEQVGNLQTRLERAYGPGLNVSFVRDPALIGGLRVRVGSDVYDGSVQSRLAALAERFS